MKLHEVLEQLEGNTELWFRPVSYKGWESAFALTPHGHIALVPTSRGGHTSIVYDASLLKGDWEIVTPDQVLNGE